MLTRALALIILLASCRTPDPASDVRGLDAQNSNIAAPDPNAAITKLRILPSNNVPKGVFLLLTPETRTYVTQMYAIFKRINEGDHLSGLEGPDQEITLVVVSSDQPRLTELEADLRRTHGVAAGAPIPFYQAIFAEQIAADAWLQDFGEFAAVNVEGSDQTMIGFIDAAKLASFLDDLSVATKLRQVFKIPMRRVGEDIQSMNVNGDRGGNIEALPDGRLYFGNTASTYLKTQLRNLGNPDAVEVETSWLAAGHVDEVTMIVPSRGQCGASLAHASTLLAFNLVKNEPDAFATDLHLPHTKAELLDALRFYQREGSRGDWRLEDFDLTRAPTSEPQAFVKANLLAEGKLRGIAAKLKEAHPCFDEVAGLPLLFVRANIIHNGIQPILDYEDWSFSGLYAAFPSTVNDLVLRRHVIVADSGSETLRRKVRETIGELSGGSAEVHFADATFFHERFGHVHCSSATVREPAMVFRPADR